MKSLTYWFQGWMAYVLPFCLFCDYTEAIPAYQNQLEEGSACKLEGGGVGECVKMTNCPEKMRDLRYGNYSDKERCGFVGFEEIVCCEKKIPGKIKVDQVRPAVAACNIYHKWWSRLGYSYVAGGIPAKPGEYPQMVALGYPAGPNDEIVIDGMQYICGGTLISEEHVLTAAHCVNNIHDLVPVEVAIMGSVTDLLKIPTRLVKRVPIAKIVKHPGYRRSYSYHDIAVIKIEKPLYFERDIRPACLMTEPLPSPTDERNVSLAVLGWGATDLDDTRSTKLLKAERLESVGINECSVSYRNLETRVPDGLDEGMICVVDPNTQRRADTCQGDSGGPLFLGWNVFPQLIGVTSFGQGCGSGTPGVYASVYKYLDWIESQVWAEGPPKSIGCWLLRDDQSQIESLKSSCPRVWNDLCLCI